MWDRSSAGGSAPAFDRTQLAQERRDGHCLVRVLRGARTEAAEDLVRHRFAAGVVRVENVALGILALQRRPEHVTECRGGDLVDAEARARTRPDQYEALDQFGVVPHDLLRDHPAHRQAQQVDAVVAQASDDASGLLARLLQGDGAAAGAHARKVEEDQVAVIRELVHEARVPVVQVGRQVHEHDEGESRGARGQLAVGDLRPVNGDERGGGGQVLHWKSPIRTVVLPCEPPARTLAMALLIWSRVKVESIDAVSGRSAGKREVMCAS